jgi:RNA polymerase sigma-70 factor (ECF subfamily)
MFGEVQMKNTSVRNLDRNLCLMERVAKRDQTAFAELFDRCSPSVLGFLVRHLRARAEAEEVLQEVFLQIWEQAASYRPDGLAPLSWMIMLARHRAIDRLRSDVSRIRRETRYEDLPATPRTAAPLGTNRIEEQEQQRLIANILRGLPFDQRTCIELAFFKGLTHRDIAIRLKAPLGTVKSRIRKGLSEMKKALAAQEPCSPETPVAADTESGPRSRPVLLFRPVERRRSSAHDDLASRETYAFPPSEGTIPGLAGAMAVAGG